MYRTFRPSIGDTYDGDEIKAVIAKGELTHFIVERSAGHYRNFTICPRDGKPVVDSFFQDVEGTLGDALQALPIRFTEEAA